MKILDLLNLDSISHKQILESTTPALDINDYKLKLERKLKYMLDLRKSNNWKTLNRYELEQNALTILLTKARKLREDEGLDSKIIRDYVETFNMDVIHLIRTHDAINKHEYR